jgi:hypothetical protein|uniref:Uncharacterized protein n=1 Tax=candidate division WOR-3 bacterium TaxID=2052148 RepID=A0A7C6AEX3_UNCW3
MNLLLIPLITQLNLYFLKDSPHLLVRIKAENPVQQVILYYSFGDEKWDSVVAQSYKTHFDAVIAAPDTINVIGFYFVGDGKLNNNNGNLYLFEVKKSPRMILPLSIDYLETILKQARKKIISQTHTDEGIALVDYVEKTLKTIPYLKGSELETKINLLMSEVNELKALGTR